MPTPRKLRTKADYLVLGGGMAGLAALAEARRLGVNAICLEARAKPGGRIKTIRNRRLARYPIELGPEFVHGPAMKQLCESLGLTLIPHPSTGSAFVDGELRPLAPMLDVFKTIRDEAARHLADGKGDSSVEEFLESFVNHDRQLPAGVTYHLMQQLIANDFATRVSDLGLTGMLAPDVDGYEDNYRIAEGYDEVARRMAGEGDIRKNHVATAVIRYRDRIDVVTDRGVYSGNAVIVCLPVGVIQAGDVRFDPPLSTGKSRAIESINAGCATKLVLGFRRTTQGTTFWPEGMPMLATSLATQLWWPTGWGRDDQRHFLASCLVGGASVARFAERDPREVGLAQLGHMFGWERVRKKALDTYYVKSWHEDPHTKGGYSSLLPGVDHDVLLRELEAPEDEADPQLFFAGDYVSRHPGAVHAAHASGIAAVERAIAARQNSP